MSDNGKAQPTVDGVQLALVTSRLEAIVRKMINTLVRTGRSGVLNTARDFSCCIITRDHELLVAAESLPIHVMSGPDLMSRAMKDFHPVVHAGDAFMHNSPYHGNSHAADHSILVPVVDSAGNHRFTLLVKAHQADCGNALPTTYSAGARDVYDEGALIFPVVKVQQNYEDIDDIIRMCEMRIRVPEQWRGDYLAMIGAARIGERGLLELGEEMGWDALEAHTVNWFNYSEQAMMEVIRALPSGRVTASSAHDPFPGVPEGIPVNVTVDVRNEDATIDVDLRANVDCQPCGLNLTEACARTAALIGVFNSIGHGVPPNAGSFRRIRVHLRENCVVGIPQHPASCSAATTNLADRVTNPVQRAMAELAEGIGMAEFGLSQPPAWGVISGMDPRAGNARYVNQIILPACTGGGAGPEADGWLTVGHVGNAGMMFRDSIEIDELHHPLIIHAQHIIPDSEGAGRFRGAPGAYVEYGPVAGAMEVRWLSDGNQNAAVGARGGLEGSRSSQYLREADGQVIPLDPCGGVVLRPGQSVMSVSCGGGGYGHPYERDPEMVRRDVAEGWVTRERAGEIYGVVLTDDLAIDTAATEERRATSATDSGAPVTE